MDERATIPEVLARWEASGASWRLDALDGDRATVSLCACTGEQVDRITIADAAGVAYLRRRPSSDD